MVASWSSGGSFNETNWHCYLTVIKAVLNNQSKLGVHVISLWLSETLLPCLPPFSFRVFTFKGCFLSFAGKPREVAIGTNEVSTKRLKIRF